MEVVSPGPEQVGRWVKVAMVVAVGGALVDLWAAFVPITVGAEVSRFDPRFALVDGPWPVVVQAITPAAFVAMTGLLWRRPQVAAEWLVGSACAFVLLDGLLTATIVQDHLDPVTGRWLAIRATATLAVAAGAMVAARAVVPSRTGPPPGWGLLCYAGAFSYPIVVLTNVLGLAEFPWHVSAGAFVVALAGLRTAANNAGGDLRWASVALVAYGVSGAVFWIAELAVRQQPYLDSGVQVAFDTSDGRTPAIIIAAAGFAAIALAALRSLTTDTEPTTTITPPASHPH